MLLVEEVASSPYQQYLEANKVITTTEINGRQEYVVGFLFNEDRTRVTLIKKTKPSWQKGKYNGVGGKIEEGEAPETAMMREFWEETGVLINYDDWKKFLTLHCGVNAVVHFFYATSSKQSDCHTVTEEMVVNTPVETLHMMPVINNLNYLIPMALAMNEDSADEFIMYEQYY